MKKLLSIKKYIVFYLKKQDFRPFEKTRGPITFERITEENVDDAIKNFSHVYEAFKEMLSNNETGVFARHKGNIVGYMWRKDYDSSGTVKSDNYLPLSGKCSHLHWARVLKEMRGRGLQLIMFSWLIRDAYEKGIEHLYTDAEKNDFISMRGTLKIGFKETFRLVVIKSSITWRTISIKYISKK